VRARPKLLQLYLQSVNHMTSLLNCLLLREFVMSTRCLMSHVLHASVGFISCVAVCSTSCVS
jgi:hypothetical protein